MGLSTARFGEVWVLSPWTLGGRGPRPGALEGEETVGIWAWDGGDDGKSGTSQRPC